MVPNLQGLGLIKKWNEHHYAPPWSGFSFLHASPREGSALPMFPSSGWHWAGEGGKTPGEEDKGSVSIDSPVSLFPYWLVYVWAAMQQCEDALKTREKITDVGAELKPRIDLPTFFQERAVNALLARLTRPRAPTGQGPGPLPLLHLVRDSSLQPFKEEEERCSLWAWCASHCTWS